MAAPPDPDTTIDPDQLTVSERFEDVQDAQQRAYDAVDLDVRSTFFETGDPPVLTHVVETGNLESDKPPLVFVHGGGSFNVIFTPLLPEFADRRLLAVDRPGFGLSGDVEPTARNLRKRAVGTIEGVLDAFSFQDAHLVCSSMGGYSGLVFALTYPDRVRELFLLGSIPTFPGTSPPIPLRVITVPGLGELLWTRGDPSPERTIEQYELFSEGQTIQQYPELIDALVAQDRTDRANAMNLAEFRALLGLTGWKATTRLRTDELRSLEPPALFIWGDDDMLATPEQVQDYVHAIPGARLERIDAGHAPWFGHPGRCAKLIRTELR